MTLERDREVELARMTIVEHLTELRTRLIRSAIAVTVASTVAFFISNRLLSWLVDPYCKAQKGKQCALVVIDPLEGFTTRIKIAMFVGCAAAAPVVLWQIWRFVTPGLHKNEKRFAIPFVVASVLLFLSGAIVAVATFPKALEFLISIGGPHLVPLFSPSRYLGLYLLVMVAFGVAFEFPLLLIFLQLARILSPGQLSRWRRPAIVIIFIVAAVITPSQDPFSLFAMALPMCAFYEASIAVGKLLKR
jgi:sec-independent protein translocase protein TatC